MELLVAQKVSSQKRPIKQKIARTALNNFLKNSRVYEVITQENKSLEASRARKFTRTFGKIVVTQFLCGTFSFPMKGLLALCSPVYLSAKEA